MRRATDGRSDVQLATDGRSDVQLAAAACVCAAAVTWGCAWVVRRQHQMTVELRNAQDALAAGAAAEERARIAREVHDVIAHSLTVTLLHVGAARLAVQDRPEDAAAALAEAERLGRRSLADVRLAVGLLGTSGDGGRNDGGPDAVPLPSAADVAALVAEYGAAGMDVDLTVTGDLDTLSAATGLALYRIAEESLANAARHAGGAWVQVRLAIDPERALLRVVNGPGAASSPALDQRPGLGLSGVRHRAGLLGGQLTVGQAGDGWRVEVDVPLDAAVVES